MSMKQKITYKNGHCLSYVEYGEQNGYPILIQHGLIASIDDYDLFGRLIQAKARLICIARPGYGDSSPYLMSSLAEWADIVASLIVELKLEQFDLLAMSSGAPYGYAIASRFPQRVRNLFIFSGMPALYDETVRSHWPYELTKDLSIADAQSLAHELFFSHLTADDLKKNDIRDSTMHNGFGVAHDLRLRGRDWGFCMADVKAKVLMRHSKQDEAIPFQTAVRTAELLPDCTLQLTESGPHFSEELLDNFIERTMMNQLKRVEPQ